MVITCTNCTLLYKTKDNKTKNYYRFIHNNNWGERERALLSAFNGDFVCLMDRWSVRTFTLHWNYFGNYSRSSICSTMFQFFNTAHASLLTRARV